MNRSDEYFKYERIHDGKIFFLKRLVDRSYIILDPIDDSKFATTDYFVRKHFKSMQGKPVNGNAAVKPKSEYLLKREAAQRDARALEKKGKKRCSKCNRPKAIEMFYLTGYGKHTSQCKPCRNEAAYNKRHELSENKND